MPWKETTTMSLRTEFIHLAKIVRNPISADFAAALGSAVRRATSGSDATRKAAKAVWQTALSHTAVHGVVQKRLKKL